MISEDTRKLLDELDRRAARGPGSVPATAITRLDIPFVDILATMLKVVVAQLIVSLPFVVVLLVIFLAE